MAVVFFILFIFIYIYIYIINFPFTRTQQVWDGIIQKQVFPRKDQNITTVSDYCLCPSIEDVDKFPIYFLCWFIVARVFIFIFWAKYNLFIFDLDEI